MSPDALLTLALRHWANGTEPYDVPAALMPSYHHVVAALVAWLVTRTEAERAELLAHYADHEEAA